MSAVKTLLSPLLLTVPLCLGLSACSSGPGEEEFAPQILAVNSAIFHRHPSFYAHTPDIAQRTIDIRISVNVSDPQGIEDLLKIYVIDPTDGRTISLLDANAVNGFSTCYKNNGIFLCHFHSTIHPDHLTLKNFEVVVQDLSGYTRRKTFNFLLTGGEQPEEEIFAYSAKYTGDTTNGYPALEAMTIQDNAMFFTADAGTQSFHIEFETKDDRAKEYSIGFFDAELPSNLLGSANMNSASIVSNPIIFGQPTTVDIPWSEIDFEDGYSVADIKRLHINLYDNPIPWVINNSEAGSWYNHLATSQSISLSE